MHPNSWIVIGVNNPVCSLTKLLVHFRSSKRDQWRAYNCFIGCCCYNWAKLERFYCP